MISIASRYLRIPEDRILSNIRLYAARLVLEFIVFRQSQQKTKKIDLCALSGSAVNIAYFKHACPIPTISRVSKIYTMLNSWQ